MSKDELREAIRDVLFKASGGVSDMAETETNEIFDLIQHHTEGARIEQEILVLRSLVSVDRLDEPYFVIQPVTVYFQIDDAEKRLAALTNQGGGE